MHKLGIIVPYRNRSEQLAVFRKEINDYLKIDFELIIVEQSDKKEFNKEFLGHLPIHQDLRNSADNGDPLTHSNPEHDVSKLFLNIANKIKLSLN